MKESDTSDGESAIAGSNVTMGSVAIRPSAGEFAIAVGGTGPAAALVEIVKPVEFATTPASGNVMSVSPTDTVTRV